MTLFEKLKQDRIQALKNKDETKKNILGCVIGDSSKETKSPNDAKVLSIIKKFIENNEEIISCILKSKVKIFSELESINPSDFHFDPIYYNSERENFILNRYLDEFSPRQFSKDEILTIIDAYKELGNEMSIKAIMKHFSIYLKNQYDGKMLSEIVKEILK